MVTPVGTSEFERADGKRAFRALRPDRDESRRAYVRRVPEPTRFFTSYHPVNILESLSSPQKCPRKVIARMRSPGKYIMCVKSVIPLPGDSPRCICARRIQALVNKYTRSTLEKLR